MMSRFSRTRSPSPHGSSGHSSKRRRHDEADNRGGGRPRSRSRDRADGHYGRDRRRDRSPDRSRRYDYHDDRDRDRRRDGVRDRSRDRYRERERDRDRDRRDRSRDRDRDRERDRDRDRDRDRNRDRDRDGDRHGDRRDARGKEATPAADTDAEKLRQRKEKLEAWKKKRAEQEQNEPKTPRTPGADSPAVSVQTTKPATKPAASNGSSAKPLGFDKSMKIVAAPVEKIVNGSALPTDRPVSTFGFSSKQKADAKAGKRVAVFGDEDTKRMKLERLPSPVPGEPPAQDDSPDEEDGDVVMGDTTEEGDAAAARAAAAQRAERTTIDVVVDQTNSAETMEVDDASEIDPLDAFMMGVGETITNAQPAPEKTEEQLLDNGEDVDLVNNDEDPEDILALATKMKKKKELPTVNHNKMNYEPFRRSFYVEPAELVQMTEEEVDDLRLELDGIKIRGQDCPKPVVKWSQCGLPAQNMEVISKLGFDRPTSIQSQAIPAIMSGRNVIGVAKTGSGKTIAFLLPMFRHIKDQRALEPLEGPIGLIMTPTRELAVQIHKECKPFLKASGLRAVCAYGGSPIKDQIADLKRGAEVIVCTPGRMIDLLIANSGRVTNLRRVTYVVLDEADRMFDMGFEPQVMKIIGNIRPDRQTVLFSATFPRQMEALARKILTRPVEIVVGARATVPPEIKQIIEVREDDNKFVGLLGVLGELFENDEDARALVFVDRQEAADTLLRDLMRKGYPCLSIHGGKDQIDRDSAIEDFKNGVVPVLIATSVAARGLDVKQLRLVVNYDCPNHYEDYVHRVGRTGRAGTSGTAVTYITPEQDRYAVDISKALKLSGQKIPDDVQKLVDGFQEKVKAGKEKFGVFGFGGKGLEKLDQERDMARKRERKQYGEDTGEEVAEEAPVEAVAAAEEVKDLAGPSPAVKSLLEEKIVVHRKAPASNQEALDRVKSATMAIHSRLNKTGQLRSGIPIDNKGPDAGAFHATLEINDYPQKARWAVTNRTNIAKVLEATGTSITTKGSYYAPGKTPGPGQDPKLYILVEGDTEVVVTSAMKELRRLLAEGTAAAVDSESRAPAASGRYSVL